MEEQHKEDIHDATPKTKPSNYLMNGDLTMEDFLALESSLELDDGHGSGIQDDSQSDEDEQETGRITSKYFVGMGKPDHVKIKPEDLPPICSIKCRRCYQSGNHCRRTDPSEPCRKWDMDVPTI